MDLKHFPQGNPVFHWNNNNDDDDDDDVNDNKW